jgi:hypothetical protein
MVGATIFELPNPARGPGVSKETTDYANDADLPNPGLNPFHRFAKENRTGKKLSSNSTS